MSDQWPWPEASGGARRMGAVLEALRGVGDVDFLHLQREWYVPELLGTEPQGGGRVERVVVDARQPERRANTADPEASRLPFEVRALWDAAADEAAAFSRGRHYDVAWYSPETAWFAASAGIDCPAIVDVTELNDVVARRRRASARGRDRGLLERLAGEEAAWAACHRYVARRARCLAVVSDLDRRQLDLPSVVVVPNGYRDVPLGAPPPYAGPPTLLMQGLFVHEPNLDAAYELAQVILPRVRRAVPGTSLLLVGYHGGWLDPLAEVDGVSLTGRVPEMRPMLSRAHLCAVPMRLGSGSRFKLLEAFAHGLAVVSSSIGVEGLAVRDNVHALLADDPGAFAERCASLLADRDLRRCMAENALCLLRTCYSWESITERVVAVSVAAAGSTCELDGSLSTWGRADDCG